VAQRVTEVDESSFDPRVLSLYWGFLTERQRIWLRRSRGASQPWTQDPILQVEFITNVYRILDPGTEYLLENILSMDASDEAKVFNIMLYRLMGSVPSTHAKIGFLNPESYEPQVLVDALADTPDDYRIFGDAYRVASYTAEGSKSKVENIASMFGYLAGGMTETVRRIKSSREVVEVYKVFEVMKGFGEFLAHQIVVDLLYTNKDGQKIVPFTDDEFAKAGPGCRKGIWDLMAEGVQPANMTIVLEWFRDHQVEALGEGFPFLANEDGSVHYMSLCDIQASLCEFHKYYRLYNGEKKVQVRKYDGPHRELKAHWVAMPSELVDEFVSNDLLPAATNLDTDDIDVAEVEQAMIGEESTSHNGDEPQQGGPSVHLPAMEFTTPDGHSVYISINIFVGRDAAG